MMGNVINIIDLGLTSYRETWQLQLDAVGCVQAGAQERVYIPRPRPDGGIPDNQPSLAFSGGKTVCGFA